MLENDTARRNTVMPLGTLYGVRASVAQGNAARALCPASVSLQETLSSETATRRGCSAAFDFHLIRGSTSRGRGEALSSGARIVVAVLRCWIPLLTVMENKMTRSSHESMHKPVVLAWWRLVEYEREAAISWRRLHFEKIPRDRPSSTTATKNQTHQPRRERRA